MMQKEIGKEENAKAGNLWSHWDCCTRKRETWKTRSPT